MYSGISHQFRTTVVGHLLEKEDIEKMHELINYSEHYKLQQFQSQTKLLDEKLFSKEYSIPEERIEKFRNLLNADVNQ